jgi:hypothetical protein
MTYHQLLPQNATTAERAVSQTIDPHGRLISAFEAIVEADWQPPQKMLPFLVWQYGLGELSPFLPNLYDLIDEGIRWQRVRGTPASIKKAMGWLGYLAEIEEEPARRRRWNRVQLGLDRIRDVEDPDLGRIAGVVQLSLCARSRFKRAYHSYDIRVVEAGYGKTGETLWGDHSGVYVGSNPVKWSFGRLHEIDHTMSEAELTALDTWIEPDAVELGAWQDIHVAWEDLHQPWVALSTTERLAAISAALIALSVHVCFRDTDGAVIGYARALSHPVVVSAAGHYQVGATKWAVATSNPTNVLVKATTQFGDGAGETAAHVSLVFGATRLSGVKPGQLWLTAGQLIGGHEVAVTDLSIPLGATVRERLVFILRY